MQLEILKFLWKTLIAILCFVVNCSHASLNILGSEGISADFDEHACWSGTGLSLPRSSSRCRARLYPGDLYMNFNENAETVTDVNTEQDLLKHDASIMGNDNDIETVLLWGEPGCKVTLYKNNYNPTTTTDRVNMVTHNNVYKSLRTSSYTSLIIS